MKDAFGTSLLSETCPAARSDKRERNLVQSNTLLWMTLIRSKYRILEESVKKKRVGARKGGGVEKGRGEGSGEKNE